MSSRSSQSLSNNGSNSSRSNSRNNSRSNNTNGGRRQRNGNERLLNASGDPREFHWRAMKAPKMSRKFINTSISGVTVLHPHVRPGVDTLSLIMDEIISNPHRYDEQVEQFWRNYILLIAEIGYRDNKVIDVFVYRKGPDSTGLTTQHLVMTNDIDLQSFQSLQIAMRIDGSLRITLGDNNGDTSSSSYSASNSRSNSYGGGDNPRSNNSGYNTPSTSDGDSGSDGDGSESSSSHRSSSPYDDSKSSSRSGDEDSFDYTL